MDIKSEKIKLLKAVLSIEDLGLIIDLQNYISSYKDDWFDNLTEEQKQSVEISLEQLDRGEGIPHEEVAKKLGL